MKSSNGVVFDVYEDQFERFMDVFLHLRDTDSKIDFEVKKCTELPELTEEGGFGQESQGNWRGAGGNDGGYGSGGGNFRGGYQRQSYGNGDSNFSRGGDSRGGDSRGGDTRGGGSSYYNRQNSDHTGWSSKPKE